MKLNIGSGQVKGSRFEKEWTNVDFGFEPNKEEWLGAEYLKFDITETWPIPRETADCIFASHVFEHIEYIKQRKVYEECFRVLKTGSPIRIICPDPDVFFRNWSAKNFNFIKDCYGQENIDLYGYDKDYAMAFTDMFFTDHYDHLVVCAVDMLKIFLVRAGFRKVTQMQYCNTEFPEFFGAYDDTCDNRPVMSFYLEAVK